MLVSNVGKVVNTIDVIPEPLFWELNGCQFRFDDVGRGVFRIPLLLARRRWVNIFQ